MYDLSLPGHVFADLSDFNGRYRDLVEEAFTFVPRLERLELDRSARAMQGFSLDLELKRRVLNPVEDDVAAIAMRFMW